MKLAFQHVRFLTRIVQRACCKWHGKLIFDSDISVGKSVYTSKYCSVYFGIFPGGQTKLSSIYILTQSFRANGKQLKSL